MHYLLFYEVVSDYAERRGEFREEHLTLAWQAHARGELMLGGALAEPSDGALLLFRGESSSVAGEICGLRSLCKKWACDTVACPAVVHGRGGGCSGARKAGWSLKPWSESH